MYAFTSTVCFFNYTVILQVLCVFTITVSFYKYTVLLQVQCFYKYCVVLQVTVFLQVQCAFYKHCLLFTSKVCFYKYNVLLQVQCDFTTDGKGTLLGDGVALRLGVRSDIISPGLIHGFTTMDFSKWRMEWIAKSVSESGDYGL